MLRRIIKQSCRRSQQVSEEEGKEGNGLGFRGERLQGRKGMHKKYHSTFHSMGESPLLVRKEILHKKEDEPAILAPKQARMKRKQTTEHLNFKYIQWMRFRKQGMSWIEYNMTLGVAYLWRKVQEQIEYLRKEKNVKYNEKFQQQISSINQEIDSVIGEANAKMPKAQKEELAGIFGEVDQRELRLGKCNVNRIQKNINCRNFEQYYKIKQKEKHVKVDSLGSDYCTTATTTPFKEKTITRLKSSVCKLNSIFCLFDRSIAIKKEDQLINEFFIRRSSEGKFTPSDMQELEKIMKINKERCELMNEIINNVSMMKSKNANVMLSQKLMSKISQIDLLKEMSMAAQDKREELVKSKLKTYKNIVYEIVQPEQEPQTNKSKENIEENLHSSIIDVPKRHKKMAYRSSIESSVAMRKENIHSKVSETWKDKAILKTHKSIKDQDKLKNEAQSKKISLKKLQKNEYGELMERKAHKKTIAFANGFQEQGNAKAGLKSFKGKMKSTNSLKSKKQITWQDLERNECRSFKSVKSLKSLKSINSFSNLGSSKYLRSMKTQREMKYLHGRLRQIEYASKYRNKLFKMNGLDDDRPVSRNDFLDLTGDNKDASFSFEESNISIAHQHQTSLLDSYFYQEANDHTTPEEGSSKSSIEPLPQQQLTKTNSKESLINEEYFAQPLEKETLMRQLYHRMGMISKQSNIAKQKYLILIQLEKMFEERLISQEQYAKYRTYFDRNKKAKQDSVDKMEEEIESKKQKKGSVYGSLLDFRRNIQTTAELNQINKYYYNISQFQGEEDKINQTKQQLKREHFFFHIRSFVEQKEKRRNSNLNNPRIFKPSRGILCQKGL